MSIVAQSFSSLLLRYLIGGAERGIRRLREPTPFERQAREALDRWQRTLPAGFELYPESLGRMFRDEELSSPRRDRLMADLDAGRLPDAEQWYEVLIEIWLAVVARLRAEGAEPQAFFARTQDEAQPHLHALARELERVFSTDPDRALPAILEHVRASKPKTSTYPEAAWKAELDHLRRKTNRIRIVGLNIWLDAQDALPLYVREGTDSRHAHRDGAFEVRYLPDHDAPAALVLGSPGIGKSTALRLLTARLLRSGRKILFGSLVHVARAVTSGEPFELALAAATCEGRHDQETRSALLRTADVIVLDGLDETRGARSMVAEQLELWAQRDAATRLIVASRPSPDVASLMSTYQPFALSLPKTYELLAFIDRVASAVSATERAETTRQRLATYLDEQPELGTPLLLGFLLALELSGEPQAVSSRTRLYDRVLGLLARSTRPDRPYSIDMSEREALLVLDELAWTLRSSPDADTGATIAHTAEALVTAGIRVDDPEAIVERVITFWQERGVLERVQHAVQDDIEFVHATLQEFAAGRRAARLLARGEHLPGLANRGRADDEAVLAVAATLGNARGVVEQLLAAPSDPERILMCARIVRDAELDGEMRAVLAMSLVALIREAAIPTHAAEAGTALAMLIEAGRVNPESTAAQIGDHRDHQEPARRLAVLAVSIACAGAGTGSADAVGAWVREELSGPSDDLEFHLDRGFNWRSYLNELVSGAVRVVTRRVGEAAGAALVNDLFGDGRVSGATHQELSFWAHRERKEQISEVLTAATGKWRDGLAAEMRELRAHEQEGALGFLTALELACDAEPAASESDGSALATILHSTDLMKGATVDFHAAFSASRLRGGLAALLRAWRFALALPAPQVRADIEQRRRALAADPFGYALWRLPSVPVRRPVWNRIDFTDPALSPTALLAWMKVPLWTPLALAVPLLESHPDRASVIRELGNLVEERNKYVLARLSMLDEVLRDDTWLGRVHDVLEDEWRPGVHHLLDMLDPKALQRPAIQRRIIGALCSPEVSVVRSAALALLRIPELPSAAIEAARAAFEHWTRNPPQSEVWRVGPKELEVRTIPPTPRPELVRLLVAGGRCDPHPYLADDDHEVRQVALAHLRESNGSTNGLDALLADGLDSANLILSFRSPPTMKPHEIEWILRTALRVDQPEDTRLASIQVLAQCEEGLIPTEQAAHVLRRLCSDRSPVIRDRALAALRSRGVRG